MHNFELLARNKGFLKQLNPTVHSDGRETVVLGNGFGTRQGAWSKLLPHLTPHFRVVTFDWTVDPEHFDTLRYGSVEGYRDDLLGLLEAMDIDRCLFIGHSMSCMIGMLAASAQPQRFSSMVMLCGSPCYINRPGYVGGFDQDQIDGLLAAMADNYTNWIASFAPLAIGSESSSAELKVFCDGLQSLRPDVALSMALTIFNADLRDRLDQFHTPVTIVQSRSDVAVPVEVALYLHNRWPQSHLEIIDAEGHLPHLTETERVAGCIRRHLDLVGVPA